MASPGWFFLAGGVATLLAALLPRLLSRAPLSMPMVFVGAGMVAFWVFESVPSPDPLSHPTVTVHLTELVVIISLMGAGLALDRPIGRRSWATTWRLLGIAMPITILAATLLGSWLLGIGVASALLLAAALAPTDPVLASEVQVAEPTDDEQSEDEARFSLTSEAGLNDGLAFPFVYAAVAMTVAGVAPGGWIVEWAALDVLWRISAGVVLGFAIGWLIRKLFFSRQAERVGLAERAEGFIALSAILLAYGITELIEGYGFIAVFVCACTVRAAERAHGRHRTLHAYVEHLERLLTVVVLLLVGGAVSRGILADIGWTEIVYAGVLLLLVRPLAGWLALAGGRTGRRERSAIAFFGVRGIGSLYYMAYALEQAEFPGAEQLWAVTVLVVIGSVLVHGVSAGPIMFWLDRRRAAAAKEQFGDEEKASVTAT